MQHFTIKNTEMHSNVDINRVNNKYIYTIEKLTCDISSETPIKY